MCKHFMRGDTMLVRMNMRSDYFYEYRYYKYKGEPVYEIFTFYPETNKIHSKVRLHGEYVFSIGKEYIFDQKGKVETIIDHEEAFSFTMEDVYRFIEKQALPLHKIKRYSENTNRPYWYVTFDDPADPEKAFAFYLDGKTGEVFKEYEPVKRTKKLEHPLPFMFTDSD
ncbi:MAG: hypothetical protein LUH15_20080 [Tannerellaceae bacterium]|nr:hypothetical protein [Tannerellaceae bacterium]